MTFDEGTSRRWLVVGGGILINMAMGVLYASSVFRSPLVQEFKWDPLTATWPFILATFVFCYPDDPRRAVERPPRPGAAWAWIMVTYGGGGGVRHGPGLCSAVASGVKWFPDKRG